MSQIRRTPSVNYKVSVAEKGQVNELIRGKRYAHVALGEVDFARGNRGRANKNISRSRRKRERESERGSFDALVRSDETRALLSSETAISTCQGNSSAYRGVNRESSPLAEANNPELAS